MTDGQDNQEKLKEQPAAEGLHNREVASARTAHASDIKQVEEKRTNSSDGSLSKQDRHLANFWSAV